MIGITFIPKELILYFHDRLIQDYGGAYGIRDEKLMDSAIEQPKATYGGRFLHDTLIKMAAAYGYHLCNNHPFIDGNKRIGILAMLTFLEINGIEIKCTGDELINLGLGIADGSINSKDLLGWIIDHS